MTNISAALVKELRDETNVGMMECKRALVEANGDKAAAVKILRERGIAVAAKKATRATNQGIIASKITADGQIGSLIEVNCETDFVAKNETFRAFIQTLADKATQSDAALADIAKTEVTAKIAETGENIIIRRSLRFVGTAPGLVGSYIHHGATVGVLIEVGCGKPETAAQPEFKELVKDLCLQIAASSPKFVQRTDVPGDLVASERAIYIGQVQDKPAAIVEKIADGKMNKFYEQVCLLEQAFIKDPSGKMKVQDLIKSKSAAAGDTIMPRRFARFQMGEAI